MYWRARTGLMFVFMTLILVGLGSLIGAFFHSVWLGFWVMMAVALIFSAYSYFFSKKSALRANKVHLVTEAEEPRLYNIVKQLAKKADLPMPEVGVSEVPMPNAFACGRGPKDAAVVATRGILQMLPDDELMGVFAHELSHVKNRDILVMSVASTLAAVVSYLARFAGLTVLFGSDRENRGTALAIYVVLNITVPFAALLIQLGVSRNREYLADETGGRMTGNPRALARALAHIEKGCAAPSNDYSNNNYADMWISNPLKGERRKKSLLSNLFSTHPATEDRIARLNKLAEELGDKELPRTPKQKKNDDMFFYSD